MEIVIILLIISNLITIGILIFKSIFDSKNKISDQDYIEKQLKNILDTMHQAILLFNNKSKLLFYNEQASKILNLNEANLNANALTIFESKQIRDAIVNQVDYSKFDLVENDTIYSINIYTVKEEHNKKQRVSVIVTFRNVTENRSIEKTKKDFFSHASHELKSPLTSIMGYSELVSLNMIEKEEHEEIFSRIHKQAVHMSLLVEEMSTLSRLELVSKDDNIELLNLQKILSDVVESLESIRIEKKITYIVESEAISYKANLLDINKLFKNLIENAVKYSHHNSNIYIDLYKQDGIINFIVKDNGIGILPKHQQRIFERFYRVDKGRLVSGTGLGLAIVKHILIKYDGKIEVDSQINEGTKITVKLK